MPIFTAEYKTHPSLPDVRCFEVFVSLPSDSDRTTFARAFVGDFQKSLIAKDLATKLGADVSEGPCEAAVQLEEHFAVQPTFSRSQPFSVKFSKASSRMHANYMHLDRKCLEQFFDIQDVPYHQGNGTRQEFVVLRPIRSGNDGCIEVPYPGQDG